MANGRQDQLQLLNAEYRALTGNDLFAYASAPTTTSVRYVFQGGNVFLARERAEWYLRDCIARAEGLLATTELTPGQIHAEILDTDYKPQYDMEK